MAGKRAAKRSAPPPAAAASSKETDSRSLSEESDDEETTVVSLTPASKKNPPAPTQKGKESETSDEEEEEEEEDEEEEEEPPRVVPPPALNNPPLRQGEKSHTSDAEEEEGESESDEEAPPTKLAPEQKADGLKPPSAVETKKQAAPFRRIWSADDEVRILEALAAHRREQDTLPQPDVLITSLAGSLDNRAFGSKELLAKVKALKGRYTILSKRRDIPSKEHDRRVLDIGKIVWGPAAASTNANGPPAPREFGDMCNMYPYLAEELNQLDAGHPDLFKKPFVKIDDEKAHELDVKIMKRRKMQTRLEMRRGDLFKEVTKALMELLG